jgi:hypothetical protein
MEIGGEASETLGKALLPGPRRTPLVRDRYETRTRQVPATYEPGARADPQYHDCLWIPDRTGASSQLAARRPPPRLIRTQGDDAPGGHLDGGAGLLPWLLASVAEPELPRGGFGPGQLYLLRLAGSAEEADDPGFAVVARLEGGDDYFIRGQGELRLSGGRTRGRGGNQGLRTAYTEPGGLIWSETLVRANGEAELGGPSCSAR